MQVVDSLVQQQSKDSKVHAVTIAAQFTAGAARAVASAAHKFQASLETSDLQVRLYGSNTPILYLQSMRCQWPWKSPSFKWVTVLPLQAMRHDDETTAAKPIAQIAEEETRAMASWAANVQQAADLAGSEDHITADKVHASPLPSEQPRHVEPAANDAERAALSGSVAAVVSKLEKAAAGFSPVIPSLAGVNPLSFNSSCLPSASLPYALRGCDLNRIFMHSILGAMILSWSTNG